MANNSPVLFFQHQITLKPKKRGFHIITQDILSKQVKKDLAQIDIGLCNVFLRHTSAALVLSECWDSSVRDDLKDVMCKIVPDNGVDGANYSHSLEGDDDLSAHVKNALLGSSLTIPITKGTLNIGTWQGVQLYECRDHGSARSLVITIQGQSK
mmetsp:Transcript_11863/g.17879  ORF Transcript_11863/g.17879 Transcript_11863/m.17879 type:complete len:154 (-) Transcript_11863:199-660(-)